MTDTTKSLAVIIPSRLQRALRGPAPHELFVKRAIDSVEAQPDIKAGRVTASFFVGVDPGADRPADLDGRANVSLHVSQHPSQAGALNACIAALPDSVDLVAFLEDDDRWEENYLAWALAALAQYDFVSSTQLEVDEENNIVRINDFPTPSGWIMHLRTLRAVGPFSIATRWHLDNEWLGRLAETGMRRCHMTEMTAPAALDVAHQVRPWLANVLRFGGPSVHLRRHAGLAPLVIRMVHPRSGMAQIQTNPVAFNQSRSEQEGLIQRFGRIPW